MWKNDDFGISTEKSIKLNLIITHIGWKLQRQEK